MTNKDKELAAYDFLRMLRAHIVLAGGKEFGNNELLSLKLEELLKMCACNGISFGVKSGQRENWL